MSDETYTLKLNADDEASDDLDRVEEAIEDLDVDLERSEDSAEDASSSMGRMSSKFGTVAAAAGPAAAAIGSATVGIGALGAAAVKAGSELVQMSSHVARLGDDLAKNAARIGMSVERLQEWRFVGERFGTSADQMDKGLQKLNKRFGEAQLGAGRLSTLRKELPKLDAALKETETASKFMERLPGLFRGMEKQSQKAALAQAAFGRSGRKLINMFDSQEGSIQALRSEYNELGGISEKTAARSEAFVDAQTDLAQITKDLKSAIAGQLLPSMTLFVKAGVRAAKSVRRIVSGFSEAQESSDGLGKSLFSLTQDVLVDAIGVTVEFSNRVSGLADTLKSMAPIVTVVVNNQIRMVRSIEPAITAFKTLANIVETFVLSSLEPLVVGLESTIGAMSSLASATGQAGLASDLASAQDRVEKFTKQLRDTKQDAIDNATSGVSEFGQELQDVSDASLTVEEVEKRLEQIETGAKSASDVLKQLKKDIAGADFEAAAPTTTDREDQAGTAAKAAKSQKSQAEAAKEGQRILERLTEEARKQVEAEIAKENKRKSNLAIAKRQAEQRNKSKKRAKLQAEIEQDILEKKRKQAKKQAQIQRSIAAAGQGVQGAAQEAAGLVGERGERRRQQLQRRAERAKSRGNQARAKALRAQSKAIQQQNKALRQQIETFGELAKSVGTTGSKLAKVADKGFQSAEGMKAAAGAASAMGDTAASAAGALGASVEAQAGIKAAFETAAGVAATAQALMGNPAAAASAAQHFTAAGLFTAIAAGAGQTQGGQASASGAGAGAGAGAGGGESAPNAPTIPDPNKMAEKQGKAFAEAVAARDGRRKVVNEINFGQSTLVGSTPPDVARELKEATEAAQAQEV